jgi:hypothetical protein
MAGKPISSYTYMVDKSDGKIEVSGS